MRIFPAGKQGVSETLPKCFATTVVNYYDSSIFSIAGSLRWPDPDFPRKTPKKYPKKIPQKYRKNTKMRIFWYFGVSFRYFRGLLGLNSGSPEFRSAGYFLGFFLVEIPGRAISGLCSRSGRSQIFCWTAANGGLRDGGSSKSKNI